MSRFNSWVAGARVKSLAHGITKIFLLVGSYTMLSWHYKRCLCSSTCESSLWDLDYVTSKQHTKIYAQTVQHLLCKLGSTRPVLYSEGLDSAKKKTIIIIDEKQLYSNIKFSVSCDHNWHKQITKKGDLSGHGKKCSCIVSSYKKKYLYA